MDHIGVRTLSRNRISFKNYTALRRQWAYDFDGEKATVVFEIIPALLNINEPQLPGYVSGGDKSCGVQGVGSSQDLKNVIHDYFPETRNRKIPYQSYFLKRPIIESLFLMGSIGTVAQTGGSDFDFWVCVDGSSVSEKNIEKLRKKAEGITQWCQKKFGMEAHFFVMDLDQIRRDDFGKVDEESTGSSQRQFLKEECYRTMLLVSGKIPFWWVVPPGTSEEDYESSWRWVENQDHQNLEDLVDLGFMGDVAREEFLGTALWHLSKGIKDPFKAVMKMAMMERYLSENFQGPLLCDVVKEKVFEGCKSLKEVDPYLLMLESVMAFYRQQERSEHIELLRKAFYIKSGLKLTRTRFKRRGGDYKVEVFKALMKEWAWSLDLFEDLNQIEQWSYARHLKLAEEINKFFFSTYRRLSEILRVEGNQAIDEYDLTFLGRRIFVLFAKRQNKLQLTPFLTNRRLILDRVIFRFEKDRSGKTKWALYDATRYPFEKHKKASRIFIASRVVRAASWLIFNGLYDYHTTAVEMPSNPSGLSVNDLISLLKRFQGFFLPFGDHINLATNLHENEGYDQIMIVLDMEEVKRSASPMSVDLVFKNTWGEMFTGTYPFQEGLAMVNQYAGKLNARNANEMVSKVKIHVPDSAHGMNVKKIMGQVLLHGLAA